MASRELGQVAFTVDEFHDLVRLLDQHPDWRREMQRLMLSDELLRLPAQVTALTAAQERMDARLDALTDAVHELVSAQARTEERMTELAAAHGRLEERMTELAAAHGRLEERMTELAAAHGRLEERMTELAAAHGRLEERMTELVARQDRLEERVSELAAAQAVTERRLNELTEVVRHLVETVERLVVRQDQLTASQRVTNNRLSRLDGLYLEQSFQQKGPARLGQQGFKRARVLTSHEWVSMLDDDERAGQLTADEVQELLRVDAVAEARDAGGPVWLAVEVSATVDVHDVERAVRRAQLLANLHVRTRAVVAGYRLTDGAHHAITDGDVVVLKWSDPSSRDI